MKNLFLRSNPLEIKLARTPPPPLPHYPRKFMLVFHVQENRGEKRVRAQKSVSYLFFRNKAQEAFGTKNWGQGEISMLSWSSAQSPHS